MATRNGYSLIELLIVLGIIAVLLGLLLPAVQAVRQRADEMVCKNNLHQIGEAGLNYWETTRHLPDAASPGTVGGWAIELLPYIDQKPLYDQTAPGSPISAAPDFLLRQPRIYRCPIRSALEVSNPGVMEPSNYVFALNSKRNAFFFMDAPLDLISPWASGVEMDSVDFQQLTGPHRGGFFTTHGWGSVGFLRGQEGQ
jgi:prepilin-type N-terminal cleavage/methylation domain-containing protein